MTIIEDTLTVPLQEHDIDGVALYFGYTYTDNPTCELQEYGNCTNDGIRWHADDMGAPVFCHEHFFPQEQLGYEFIAESELEKWTQ